MDNASDSATERTSKMSAWANRFISAILGIIVTVIGALVVGGLQEHVPSLGYFSTESLPFDGPNGQVSIYQVTVSNDGKGEASDVASVIRIPVGTIDQYKITANPLLNASGATSPDSVTVRVPNLNPSESFQVSILATGTAGLPSKPQIFVRGKGALGVEKNPGSNGKSQFDPTWLVLAGAISAVVGTSVFGRLFTSTKLRSSFGDDQRQVLGYICRAHGLKELADEYSTRSHETTYWAEADRLGQIAIDGRDRDKTVAIEKVLMALIDYASMASTSKAIVFLNVALISRSQNDEVNYKKYLGLATNMSKRETERRLKIDPRFPGGPNSV